MFTQRWDHYQTIEGGNTNQTLNPSMNILRGHLFASSTSDLWSLPPTQDAINLHVRHALYQVMVCKCASITDMDPMLPLLTPYRRELINNKLIFILTPPLPSAWNCWASTPLNVQIKDMFMCMKMCKCRCQMYFGMLVHRRAKRNWWTKYIKVNIFY